MATAVRHIDPGSTVPAHIRQVAAAAVAAEAEAAAEAAAAAAAAKDQTDEVGANEGDDEDGEGRHGEETQVRDRQHASDGGGDYKRGRWRVDLGVPVIRNKGGRDMNGHERSCVWG
jgi:hypothetical protein